MSGTQAGKAPPPEDDDEKSGNDTAASGGDDTAPGGDDTSAGSGNDSLPGIDWRDRRIARLTGRLREAEARAAAQPPPSAGDGNPAPPAVGLTPDSPEFAAAVRAQADAMEFNRQCDEVAASGRKSFADFDARVGGMVRALVDPTDRDTILAYNSFLSAAIETGDPAKIIYEVAKDLSLASELMSMSPVKRAARLAKMLVPVEASDEAPARPSGAPKPVTPINSNRNRADSILDPSNPEHSKKMTDRQWIESRRAQVKEREDAKAAVSRRK